MAIVIPQGEVDDIKERIMRTFWHEYFHILVKEGLIDLTSVPTPFKGYRLYAENQLDNRDKTEEQAADIAAALMNEYYLDQLVELAQNDPSLAASTLWTYEMLQRLGLNPTITRADLENPISDALEAASAP